MKNFFYKGIDLNGKEISGYLLAEDKSIAENILKWIPKGTHDYNKLIKPEELKKTLTQENFHFKNIKGLVFDPLKREWKLSNNYMINYFCTANLIN